jgi:hypothetical protein
LWTFFSPAVSVYYSIYLFLFIYLVFQGKIKQPKCKSCREFRAEFHLKGRTMFGYRALSGHVTGLTRSLKKFTTNEKKRKKSGRESTINLHPTFLSFFVETMTV